MLYHLFWIIWAVAILLVLAYGAVIPFGAIFVPTLKAQRQQAIELINLKRGQTLYDLGSGDGSMLVLAAQRGLKSVGYELNPFLFVYSWLRTRRYGRRVKVRYGNFWHADLSQADGVYVFLMPHFMKKLDKMLAKQTKKRSLKLVSNSFKIPGKKAAKRLGPLYLYLY